MKPVHRLLFHWFVCLSMMLGFYHSLSAQSPASGVSKEQYVGEWNYLNTSDDSRAAQYFTSSGALREKGEGVGAWHLVGEHLIVTYKHHPWVYTYDLPPKEGVLHGTIARGMR